METGILMKPMVPFTELLLLGFVSWGASILPAANYFFLNIFNTAIICFLNAIAAAPITKIITA